MICINDNENRGRHLIKESDYRADEKNLIWIAIWSL